MADSQVDVVESAQTSVTHLDAETLTVGAQTVKRERHRIAGGAAAELSDVRNTAPATTDYGLIVRQAGMRRSGSTTYGASSDPSPVSSGTTGSTTISLGYLFHPSSVTTLLYRLQRLVVTWSGGIGGVDALIKFAQIIAENGTPGGVLVTPVANNQGSAASNAIFRAGATGAPTRVGTVDTASINLGAYGCAIFAPPDNADGQDYEMRKSQAEGWEVRLVVNTAPTVAASFSVAVSWREEAA